MALLGMLVLSSAIGCGSDDGGGSPTDGGAGTAAGGTSGGGGSSSGGGGAAGGGSGGASSGGASSGGASSGGASAGGTGGGSSDPFEAARQTCIDHINKLRAGKGRAPYQRWTSAETCVDGQATYDSTHGPHAAFSSGNSCGAYGQGECPGSGPGSVVGCIDLMWAEKDQAICANCDACPSLNAGFAGKCPGCQVTASNPTCGHYLALVSPGFKAAACGFSTGSPYTAIDYQ
ncbi:MAG: hypothetical protein IT377_02130 [Polyangiaceae bacterium]|nr:hypothetical protein [Polyangiaceae bacterium]